MNKIISVLLAGLLGLSTAGCASQAAPTGGNPSQAPNSAENSEANEGTEDPTDGIEVDEGLLTVDITFPASLVSTGEEAITQEQIDSSVAEQGYLGGKLNDDGSVTYTMTKLKQREMLDELRTSFDDSIRETLAEYPNVKSITRNDDFSEISIEVTEQDLATGFLAFGFSVNAYFYQVLDGKEFATDIVFIDANSGEELSRTSYPLAD